MDGQIHHGQMKYEAIKLNQLFVDLKIGTLEITYSPLYKISKILYKLQKYTLCETVPCKSTIRLTTV